MFNEYRKFYLKTETRRDKPVCMMHSFHNSKCVCVCVCSYSNWLTHMVYALLIALVTPCLLLEDLNGVLILHIQLQKKSKQHFLTWLFRCPVGVHAAKWIDFSPMTIQRTSKRWLTSFKQLVTTFLVGQTQNSLLYCQLMDASVDSNCIHQLILRLPQFKCTRCLQHYM